MKDSTLRILGNVLGVLQFLVAAVNFDPNSWNQIVVSVLLFLGGILMLTVDASSATLLRARAVISYFVILLSAGLVIKVLFFD